MPNDSMTLPLTGKSPQQQRAAGYLKDRAVPVPFAVKCGIRVQRAERRKGFNGAATKSKERDGAIAIPYFNHDGSQRDFVRWRLFDADHKFDQDPGTGVHVYMPPLRHKTLTMQQVLDDPSIQLNIAEGETRALVLNYYGIPTVAIGGMDNWGKGGELCTDLLRIPMQGRHVPLLVDADVPQRKDKQNRIKRFTEQLEKHGAQVYWLPAPDLGDGKSGFDDLVAKRGIGEFRKLLKDAKPSTHPDFASWGHDGIDIDLSLSPISLDWLLEAPAPLEWTWAGFLPRGTVALLNGQGGAGKSFFVQGLLQCIAAGRPFLGQPTRQGKAVHIACEEAPDELRRRQYKTFQYETADMEPAKVKRFATALQSNLYIRSVVGQQMHLVTTIGNNVIQGRALDVLIHQLKALGDVEMVVVDPISRAHSASEENAAAWGTAMMNALSRLAIGVGCAVIAVHHTGKAKSQGGEREDLYSGRGSSALPDAARVVLQLKVAQPADCRNISNISDDQASTGQILRLINSKQSYGPRQRETWLRRAEGGVLEHFEPERRASVSDNTNIQMLREWWQAHDRRPLFRETIRKQFKEVFRDTLPRRPAMKVFESAVLDGLLIPITDAKNPRSQGYVFRDGGAQ